MNEFMITSRSYKKDEFTFVEALCRRYRVLVVDNIFGWSNEDKRDNFQHRYPHALAQSTFDGKKNLLCFDDDASECLRWQLTALCNAECKSVCLQIVEREREKNVYIERARKKDGGEGEKNKV